MHWTLGLGDAWRIEHGVSYVLEEQPQDFSNNYRFAALYAGACNPSSIFLFGGGGCVSTGDLASPTRPHPKDFSHEVFFWPSCPVAVVAAVRSHVIPS